MRHIGRIVEILRDEVGTRDVFGLAQLVDAMQQAATKRMDDDSVAMFVTQSGRTSTQPVDNREDTFFIDTVVRIVVAEPVAKGDWNGTTAFYDDSLWLDRLFKVLLNRRIGECYQPITYLQSGLERIEAGAIFYAHEFNIREEIVIEDAGYIPTQDLAAFGGASIGEIKKCNSV